MPFQKPWHPPTAPEMKEPISIGIAVLGLLGVSAPALVAGIVGSVVIAPISRSIAFPGDRQ